MTQLNVWGRYTLIVTRKSFFACLLVFVPAFCGPAFEQQPAPAQPPANNGQAQEPPDESEPPEEDDAAKPRTYPFNPLEADRNIKVGNFYMHQGTARGYRAAVGRFEDATKYNPNSAEAFFRLGEAEQKLKNKDKAKAAFQRVVQIAPDSKLAKDAKKRLGQLS
ncbi:MAG: tetratricopeptide repeat protein [Acidobacteriia bacterium]|nr:tetratricopeptide repeat protein [Terriglobia bacterium]